MPTITWNGGGVAENVNTMVWAGVTFHKNIPTETNHPHLLRKAAQNTKYFTVAGYVRGPDPALSPPPSQQNAQHAVPKGGEPIWPDATTINPPENFVPPPQNGDGGGDGGNETPPVTKTAQVDTPPRATFVVPPPPPKRK